MLAAARNHYFRHGRPKAEPEQPASAEIARGCAGTSSPDQRKDSRFVGPWHPGESIDSLVGAIPAARVDASLGVVAITPRRRYVTQRDDAVVRGRDEREPSIKIDHEKPPA
jgi:hypothetical protein